MARSMTGFGRVEAGYDWGSLCWEIRTVNHRYLEPHFRLPDSQRGVETALRDLLRKAISRGKLEATLQLKMGQADSQELGVDAQRVAQVLGAVARLARTDAELAPVDPLDLLRWPGVIVEPSVDPDTVQHAVLDGFAQALAQLVANRAREGRELAQCIEQRLTAVADQVAEVRRLMPGILQAQRERLQARLAELQVQLDAERLEQEVVLLAQKADVAEELDRLTAHIAEVRRTLGQPEAMGRRLDFLMQELNREANTLSSKSVVSETTQAAVELKVLIEQMREQVQNIE